MILVTGATGNVGREVVKLLADRVQRPGPSSTAVEQILGRPARTFADWAADHADVFRATGSRTMELER